jgi:glutamate--cysteine ligase
VLNPHHILDEASLYTMVARELFAASPGARGDGIGLELELFPRVPGPAPGTMLPAPLRGEGGVIELVRELAEEEGGEFVDDPSGAISAVLPGGGAITLEPAGQIEYSGPALGSARAALDDLERAVDLLDDAAARRGIELVASGYSGGCAEEALTLQVCKPRYLAMDSYFESIGSFGRRMMRGTCSLQINLDFGSPESAAERWRLANMIAPSLNAIFANSPLRHEGRSYRSFRYEIWRRLDPGRTGRLYDRPDLDPVADYLRFALDAGVMLIADGGEMRPLAAGELTFRRWIAGERGRRHPGPDDWRLHLSTLFPDVRARGWMEIRSIDALPRPWRAVPVAMVAALFHRDDMRREALERIEYRHRRRLRGEHEHDGFWRSDFETGSELLGLAIPAIDDQELAATAIEYHERFCTAGLTPADLVPAEGHPINL